MIRSYVYLDNCVYSMREHIIIAITVNIYKLTPHIIICNYTDLWLLR